MMGFIYAIQSGDAVKIGFAAEPARRVSELNVGSPSIHRLLGFIEGTKEQEAEAHRLLRRWRVRGEWFRLEGAVLAFVHMLPPYAPDERQAPKPVGASPSPVEIIDLWPSFSALSCDIGLKSPSHVRTMRVRRRIPRAYWHEMALAAERRKIQVTLAMIRDAHGATLRPDLWPSPSTPQQATP
jgi:hypothetical protein